MDFKKIGIVGAMEIEIEIILKNMNSFVLNNHGMFNFYEGFYGDKEIVVVKSGAGKVNSSSCTQMLIDKYKVDCVINTGIAGGIAKNLNVCDLVISTDVTYHDVNPVFMKEFFPFRESFSADHRLIQMSKKAVENFSEREYNYFVGRIVSGDSFINSSEDKEKIVRRYDPLCVEMEGASIGHVCYLNDIPFVVIRSISDNADDDAAETYEEFERRAAEQSAKLILDMIKG